MYAEHISIQLQHRPPIFLIHFLHWQDYAHNLQNFFVDIYLFHSSLTLKQHTCQFARMLSKAMIH